MTLIYWCYLDKFLIKEFNRKLEVEKFAVDIKLFIESYNSFTISNDDMFYQTTLQLRLRYQDVSWTSELFYLSVLLSMCFLHLLIHYDKCIVTEIFW